MHAELTELARNRACSDVYMALGGAARHGAREGMSGPGAASVRSRATAGDNAAVKRSSTT
ncbi:hypothetical protein SGLAM104S_07449 [Streptomyces glaucescens]